MRTGNSYQAKLIFLFKDRSAFIGFSIFLALIAMAIFAPLITPYEPYEQNAAIRYQPPSPEHWMGTDQYGRDITSRIVYGSRISLYVGIASVLLGGIIGTFLGISAGYFRGKLDYVVGWFTDVLMAFPTEVLAIAVVIALGASSTTAVIAIGVVFISRYIRLVRASTMAICEAPYIEAAKSIGQNSFIIMFKHILPNILGDLIIMTSLWIATAIRIEAVLSFLGLGAQPPDPSWGVMIKDGLAAMMYAPWLAIIPGLAIFITVLGFNMLGDSFRDFIDPKLQK